jgi:prepilin-type N-terminal cleavage/methylation domain-containing protein
MKQESNGFTFAEVLVVIAVIVLLTAILIPNWRLGEDQLTLQRSVAKVGQDISRAAELTLRVQSHTCASGSISGYGIYFETSTPSSYVIFADCNASSAYEAVSDDVVEQISLENRVEISALSPSPSFSVVFTPPKPAVSIMPGSVLEGQVTLQIGGGPTKAVRVNNKGVVDIE